MGKKLIKKEKKDPTSIILGGEIYVGANHPNYKKSKEIVMTGEETVRVRNPITMKTADVVISRNGTTAEKLAMIMLAPDATKEQKDGMVASYLFERGNESGSFLAELFMSKGVHVKDTQAFKANMRFDFEMFADKIVGLFQDISRDITEGIRKHASPYIMFGNLAERLEKGAELINSQRDRIKEARMRDKGYGIYINKDGQSFSVFDDEIEQAVRNDKEAIEKHE